MEKDQHFLQYIVEPFETWKINQKTIQYGAEKEHMREYKTKMQVFKNDFALLLKNKYNEG